MAIWGGHCVNRPAHHAMDDQKIILLSSLIVKSVFGCGVSQDNVSKSSRRHLAREANQKNLSLMKRCCVNGPFNQEIIEGA